MSQQLPQFWGPADEAFVFDATGFSTEPSIPLKRFADMPAGPGALDLFDHEKSEVLNIELLILAGQLIMPTDMQESMGQECRIDNNTTLHLKPNTGIEARCL